MILLILSLYLFVVVLRGMLVADYPQEENIQHRYVDDEPDGSNYVTLPNGERRLD
jgi:hypothetical protein